MSNQREMILAHNVHWSEGYEARPLDAPEGRYNLRSFKKKPPCPLILRGNRPEIATVADYVRCQEDSPVRTSLPRGRLSLSEVMEEIAKGCVLIEVKNR